MEFLKELKHYETKVTNDQCSKLSFGSELCFGFDGARYEELIV